MTQKTILIFCSCILSYNANSQISKHLLEIEKNNYAIQVSKQKIKRKLLNLERNNVLPNPEIGAYYLPYGNTLDGKYSELQISQKFEFPTVYTKRKELIQSKKQLLDYGYLQNRKNILLKAKQLILKIIASNKLLFVENKRLDRANKLFNQHKKLFDSGELGILEFNKSEVVLMKTKFKVQEVKTEILNLNIQLQQLNNSVRITVDQTNFETDLKLANKEQLWDDLQKKDITLQSQGQMEEIAAKQIKLVKAQNLPNLTLGYNYQGFSKDNVHGIFAGATIPLWGNKIRKEASEEELITVQNKSTVAKQALKVEFDTQYNSYMSLLNQFNKYEQILASLNPEKLLLKAYDLGEISFTDYFIELEFYKNAQDAKMTMEKQLQLAKSKLMSFEL